MLFKINFRKVFLYSGLLLGLLVAIRLLYLVIKGQFTFAPWTGFDGKTLWDWLELLGIPVVLAVGAAWINWSQRQVELMIAKEKLEDEILQSVYDELGRLIMEKDLLSLLPQADLLEEINYHPVVNLARTRTISALGRLSWRRREALLRFLRDTRIYPYMFVKANLERMDLSRVHLNDADLRRANLGAANLSPCQIRRANLNKAHLVFANLSWATLFDSTLEEAYLYKANLKNAHLDGANLKGAILKEADLRFASLEGVNLENANLLKAKVTQAQLKKAASLKGATMPDGSIHP